MGQVTTCAVKEEAENLLEQFVDGSTLGVLAHGAEETVEMREKVDAAQVASEEVEACPSRQAVVGDLDLVDEISSFGFEFGHPALHHMGETILTFCWM